MDMTCDFSCEELNRYRVDLPYPPVKIEKPSKRNAILISGAFGGRGSEMTAITQYLSHNFHTEAYPEVHNALKYIAITEMGHFDLLGKLILKLGLNPVVGSFEDNSWWSGEYPAYGTDIGEMLLADIEGERAAIAHYKRIISRIDDKYIITLLRRIIMDEEKHIEVLTPFYMRYGRKS